MANEKITELTALTSGSVAGTDVIPIVDISDTSVSVTGQSKKITQEALFDSGTSMPSLVEVGTITTGTWTGTTLGVGYGGTGLASFTSGDILYASGTTTLAKLAKGSDGDTLTLSSGVPAWSATTGDITGVTAGTNLNGGGTSGAVTLNVDNPVVADLTGDVTGDLTGNADTVTNGVYTTNNLSVMAATTSAQLAGVISDETGSGSLVFATSPTLVTPALGTPASGVATNLTGTASGLTAGTVTTNANLTGGVTSVGNAATVITNANLTGGVTSVGNAATVITNANLTGDVTSVGNATTIATDAVDIAMLSATGTASSSTYLRGDNTWATVSGGGGGDVSKVGIPADSQVGVWTGDGTIEGTNSLFFDSTGLGIGTDAPKRDVHIHNAASATTKLQITNAATGGSSDGDGFQLGIGSDGTANIEQRENLDLAFTTNNTERMRIDAAGLIGLGGTPVSRRLEVFGTDTVTKFESTGSANVYVELANTTGSNDGHIAYEGTSIGLWANDGGGTFTVTGSGQAYGGVTSAASAATTNVSYTVDFSSTNLQKLTLDAAVSDTLTFSAATNHVAGATVKLYVDQSSASLLAIAAPGGWKWYGTDLTTGWPGGNFIMNLTSWGAADSAVTVEVEVAA